MATAQTASSSRHQSSASRLDRSPGGPSGNISSPHSSAASHGRALGAMGRGGDDDLSRGTKRRIDEDDREEGYSSPAYSSVRNDKGPPSSYSRNGGGGPAVTPTYASPRTQLPSFNSLSSRPSHDDLASKKRRGEEGGGGAGYPDGAGSMTRSPYPAYSREPYPEDDRYARRAGPPAPLAPPPHRSNGGASPGAAPTSASLSYASQQRSPDYYRSDDGYDGNVPLARRRGDAAQAKAKKLHIDVESASSDRTEYDIRPVERGNGGSHQLHPHHAHAQHAPRFGLPPPPEGGLVARSAPPTRLHFSDRAGEDPRADFDARRGLDVPHRVAAPPGGPYGPAPPALAPPPGAGYAAGGAYGSSGVRPLAAPSSMSRGAAGEAHVGSSPPRHAEREGAAPPLPSSVSRSGGPPQHGRDPGPGPTPLTARFVPQTANLPSPAYHTTRFVQSTSAGQPAGGAPAPSAAPGGAAPPRTAGLQPSSSAYPPQTARPLVADAQQPTSSGKAQFLSLFSSFYDSLSDSRTLKATLEDQVRRSNTLLQTLQRSSRVLEATVDRKIREERAIWEERMKRLEGRVRVLEGGPEEEDEVARDELVGEAREKGAEDHEAKLAAEKAEARAASQEVEEEAVPVEAATAAAEEAADEEEDEVGDDEDDSKGTVDMETDAKSDTPAKGKTSSSKAAGGRRKKK